MYSRLKNILTAGILSVALVYGCKDEMKIIKLPGGLEQKIADKKVVSKVSLQPDYPPKEVRKVPLQPDYPPKDVSDSVVKPKKVKSEECNLKASRFKYCLDVNARLGCEPWKPLFIPLDRVNFVFSVNSTEDLTGTYKIIKRGVEYHPKIKKPLKMYKRRTNQRLMASFDIGCISGNVLGDYRLRISLKENGCTYQFNKRFKVVEMDWSRAPEQ